MLRVGTGEHLIQYARFPTGLCHLVFDVLEQSGERFVVRVASDGNERRIDGSIYWATLLRPIGIPLPEIRCRGVLAPRPFTVGHAFNRDSPPTDSAKIFERRIRILEALLSELAKIDRCELTGGLHHTPRNRYSRFCEVTRASPVNLDFRLPGCAKC